MNFRPQMCDSGGVAERLIAPVLKTGRPKGLVSSNLTPSVTAAWQRLFCEVLQGSLNCDFLRLTTGGGYLYFVFASLSSARP